MLNNQVDIDLRFEKIAYYMLPSGEFRLLFCPRATGLGLLHKQHQALVRLVQQRTWAPMLDYESSFHPLVEINKVF